MAGNLLEPGPDGRRVYVALRDSFTEGVGDYSNRLPNGVRDWADRMAEQLAQAEPGWEYANLAIRSKRLRHITAEQLEPALALEPTPVTLYAGGNDILDFGTDVESLMEDYESLGAALAASGAVLVGYWCPDAFHDRRMWDATGCICPRPATNTSPGRSWTIWACPI